MFKTEILNLRSKTAWKRNKLANGYLRIHCHGRDYRHKDVDAQVIMVLSPHHSQAYELGVTALRAYLITNLINDKKYVGITIKKVIKKRWDEHVNCASRGCNHALHMAIIKYGKENFTFDIVACASTHDGLKAIEIALVKQYNTFVADGMGYNVTRGGDGTIGYSHAPETKAAWSAKRRGVKLTPEHIEKVRLTNTGSKRSDETRKKMSESATGRVMPRDAVERSNAANRALAWITDGNEDIRIKKIDATPDGWRRGRTHGPQKGLTHKKPRSAEACAKLSAALRGVPKIRRRINVIEQGILL